ncbi:peptide N-acetyl-beta-D-glucosaminyl asparaginase amidase A-domain-containing protein [Xylariomycetidae sp. FL0641]|nr:peptide N-acetyl-beta-D-glucosaminyl asparaginase amidase A-domain-containing protein [Xylariomycetidae sp. FL0641]
MKLSSVWAALFVGFAWGQSDLRYRWQKAVRRDGGPLRPLTNLRTNAIGLNATSTSSAPPAATTPPLECFQVAEPVLTPHGITRRDLTRPPRAGEMPVSNGTGIESPACTVTLMEYMFSNSYGAPFVGNYTPPDCDFDRVVMNFTTLVKGRQYDRTGTMYLGDTEVWRTSTAEPTSYGIRWEWLKDMTAYASLWKSPQTIIFDLENIVDDTYTGILNTTLTATFFKSPVALGDPPPADMIIPISQRLGSAGEPSQFVYPDQNATSTVSFPRNANRAVFTVDVKGQGNEEFWWSNVPQSAINTFEAEYGTYPGYSPFREVQVLVDGQLAGVVWPYPVIYTGGVVPQLNRPIVGTEAFDILEQQIDISPWLPLLCDGNEHTFTIRIVGLDDDGSSSASLSNTTGEEWYVTGKVFLWLDDDEDSITTGTMGAMATADPTISFSQTITQNSTGANETIRYNIAVSRSLSIDSYVKTQHQEGTATWSQSLSYSNIGGVTGFGYNNLNTFNISGKDSASGLGSSFSTVYSYPLYSNSTATYGADDDLTLWAELDQGLDLEIRGASVFPSGLEPFLASPRVNAGFAGSRLQTQRDGTAQYFSPGDNSYSTGCGQTQQTFTFLGLLDAGEGAEAASKQLYRHDVSAFNNTVIRDRVEVA